MILAGDIGGTKTRLACFESPASLSRPVLEAVFASQEYDSLRSIVSAFMATHQVRIERACFGIAGPVRDGRVTASNLVWQVDAGELADALDITSVRLINDLEAHAYGIPTLAADDLVVLHPGSPEARGNAALIAAGTGLGEAGLHWTGTRYWPFASEGGHTDFAPRHDLEIELLRYLQGRFGRVSYERVLSGPGLQNIYTFLRDTGRGEEPAWLAERLCQDDPAAVITRAALAAESELCAQTLDLFVAIYGAEAGNLALKMLATGGVYIGGGIAPKILDKLREAPFMQAFVTKGRLRPVLEAIPVSVITNDKTALLGAAHVAAFGDAA